MLHEWTSTLRRFNTLIGNVWQVMVCCRLSQTEQTGQHLLVLWVALLPTRLNLAYLFQCTAFFFEDWVLLKCILPELVMMVTQIVPTCLLAGRIHAIVIVRRKNVPRRSVALDVWLAWTLWWRNDWGKHAHLGVVLKRTFHGPCWWVIILVTDNQVGHTHLMTGVYPFGDWNQHCIFIDVLVILILLVNKELLRLFRMLWVVALEINFIKNTNEFLCGTLVVTSFIRGSTHTFVFELIKNGEVWSFHVFNWLFELYFASVLWLN